MRQLILASESARRRELLNRLGVAFHTQPADVQELQSDDDPRRLPQLNAVLKATAVARLHPESLVLGADTVIHFNGRIIGKPRDPEDAAAILRTLSGRTHEVITGIALISESGRIHEEWSEVSEVTFKPFGEEVISRYLAVVPVLDKAGAYAIQDHGDWIVERHTGEVENIIGLPLQRLGEKLRRLL